MKSRMRWKMNPFNGILRGRTSKLQENIVGSWSRNGQHENFLMMGREYLGFRMNKKKN